MSLDAYWATYDATLARVRAEKPNTFAALKAILDTFEPPSSGDAFFPGGADDDLADALNDAGWELHFRGPAYIYMARHPLTGAKLNFLEGDLYDRTRPAPTHIGARVALVSSSDKHTRLQPNALGTVVHVDDLGTVHVEFDTGEALGLIPGEDVWRALPPRWDSNPMVQTSAPIQQDGHR